MLKLTDNNLVAHQSGKKTKNLPCLKRKDIFSFVLVRKQKMELTVTSGFINNPPVSHVCKPRDKKLPSWHKLRNTAHVCDQNGHSRWTPAPFMAFIDVKEQFKKKARRAVYRQGCSICKVTGGQEEFGVFLGKKGAATLHLKFPPLFGMQVHGPAFLTQASHRNTVFPVWDTNNQQVTAEASPPLT